MSLSSSLAIKFSQEIKNRIKGKQKVELVGRGRRERERRENKEVKSLIFMLYSSDSHKAIVSISKEIYINIYVERDRSTLSHNFFLLLLFFEP